MLVSSSAGPRWSSASHLMPLPGSPRYAGETVKRSTNAPGRPKPIWRLRRRHRRGSRRHSLAKPDDIGPETSAHVRRLRRIRHRRPIGINVPHASIPACRSPAPPAGFVTRQSVGQRLCRQRGSSKAKPPAPCASAQIRANGIRIFAGAHVKHGAHAIVADRRLRNR